MIWIYDETFEGFLTAIFEVYKAHDETALILGGREVQLGLVEQHLVVTDESKANRVQRKLDAISEELTKRLYNSWLSQEAGIEQAILTYIRLCIEQGQDVYNQRYNDTVQKVIEAARHVTTEVYHFEKFTRFIRVGRSVYLADVEPGYDILEMLTGLFEARLTGYNFLIRDQKRGKCLVYDQKNHWISYDTRLMQLSAESDSDYEQLWQTYFTHIAIPQRVNPKLQTLHVPKRYRKYMTEFL